MSASSRAAASSLVRMERDAAESLGDRLAIAQHRAGDDVSNFRERRRTTNVGHRESQATSGATSSSLERIRLERRVEQLVVARRGTMHGAFAEWSEHGARAFPIGRNRKQRQRPAEVAVVAAARRFGDGVEPRARERTVEQRGERVRVALRRDSARRSSC